MLTGVARWRQLTEWSDLVESELRFSGSIKAQIQQIHLRFAFSMKLRHDQLVVFALGILFCTVVQAAGVLRVLTWPGYADTDIVHAFEVRHGVQVEVTYVSSDDVLWEKLSRHGGQDFDVFAVNTAELQRYIDKQLSVPINLHNIPNTHNQIPRFANLGEIPGLMRHGKTYGIPYTYSEMGIIYDRKRITKEPVSLAVLWDTRYRGRVIAYQGSTHNFTLAAMALGMRDPFHIPGAEFGKVARKLIDLRRNALAFYSQPEEATALFMERKATLMLANYGSQQVQQLRQAGADIGYFVPHEGALAWLDCWAISKGVRQTGLAEAWINYMLEPQVGRALTTRQGLPNTLEESKELKPDAPLIWLKPVEDAARRAQLWDQVISGDRPERLP